MWIMLIQKLPVNPSPPKLSIFWSTLLGEHKYATDQIEIFLKEDFEDHGLEDFDLDENGHKFSDELLWEKARMYLSTQCFGIGRGNLFGSEHNWVGARQILYKDTQITVFPDEFSVMKHENMAMYVLGTDHEGPSHELVAGTIAEKEIALDILDGSRREIYDAAMSDGASKEQAYAMALGIDVSSENFTADFPAVGWYRCKPEYAEYYCSPSEMTE